MRWALFVVPADDERSLEPVALSRALESRGLRVRQLGTRPADVAGDRGAEAAANDRADVVLVDAIGSNDLEAWRAAIMAARVQGRALVVAFREDQLVFGVDWFGFGAPAKTCASRAGGAEREAFLAAIEAMARDTAPEEPDPVWFQLPPEAWRDVARRDRWVAAIGGPVLTFALWWMFAYPSPGNEVLGAWGRAIAWAILATGAIATMWGVASGGLGEPRPTAVALAPDALTVIYPGNHPVQIAPAAVCAVHETPTALQIQVTERLVTVPRRAAAYAQLRSAIAGWHPIERRRIDLPSGVWVVAPLLIGNRWPGWLQPLALLLALAVGAAIIAASLTNEGLSRARRWAYRVGAALLILTLAFKSYARWEDDRAFAAVVAGPQRIHLGFDEGRPTLDLLDRALRDFMRAEARPLGPDTGAASPAPRSVARAWVVDARLASRLVAGTGGELRARGMTLVRVIDAPVGSGEGVLAAFATTDPRTVVRAMGTAAPEEGITTAEVVATLEALAAVAPFELTAVGARAIEGRITDVPADPIPAARILARLGTGSAPVSVDAIARELARSGRFALALGRGAP